MTKKFKFALMSSALFFGVALTSCSSEGPSEPSAEPAQGNMLIKSPEMIAYSSSHVHSTYGSKAAETGEGEVEEPYVSHNDVEINLSLNEDLGNGTTQQGETFDKDYIASHLSIHVRTARDVEVRVPVPVDYYCEADDMLIVKKHLAGNFVYGDQEHELSMKIGEETVTVKVAYDEEGFTVTTSGINEDVIASLAKDYKDGITFEIWNYYNTEATREALKDLLDDTTVEFVGGCDNVDFFVNAINELVDRDTFVRTVNPWDCEVNIISDPENNQDADFEEVLPGSVDYVDGFHGYNASTKNRVFKHKAPAEPAE